MIGDPSTNPPKAMFQLSEIHCKGFLEDLGLDPEPLAKWRSSHPTAQLPSWVCSFGSRSPTPETAEVLGFVGFKVNPRKLGLVFRTITARIPYTIPHGHEDNYQPTSWLLL